MARVRCTACVVCVLRATALQPQHTGLVRRARWSWKKYDRSTDDPRMCTDRFGAKHRSTSGAESIFSLRALPLWLRSDGTMRNSCGYIYIYI